MKKWLAKSRPKLKPELVAQRLRWAMERRTWTAEDFEGIIWSDECSVEKSKDPRQMWVFREPDEKWLAECIQPKPKGKGISLMVWGCFCGRQKGPLVPVRQSITAVRYLRLLRRYLVPFIAYLLSSGVIDLGFQQDNAPVHKAYIVMDWLEDMYIQVEDHPPYSPDLNPIEHV